jgi:hypothetical protein
MNIIGKTYSSYHAKYRIYGILNIIVIIIFQGLGLLACSSFRIYFLKLMNLFGQLVGLLGWATGPMQGLYIYTGQPSTEKCRDIHALSGIQTHDPSVQVAEDSICLGPFAHWEFFPTLIRSWGS